jgi:hypothetical protein
VNERNDGFFNHDSTPFVIPAKAGIQLFGEARRSGKLDPGLRRDDEKKPPQGSGIEGTEAQRSFANRTASSTPS